jgi:hypothetical protein
MKTRNAILTTLALLFLLLLGLSAGTRKRPTPAHPEPSAGEPPPVTRIPMH